MSILKEQLPEYMIKELKNRIPEKFLNLEITKKTEFIPEGEWELSDEDKNRIFTTMFYINQTVLNKLEKWNINSHFINIFKKSYVDPNLDLDIEKLNLSDWSKLYTANFYGIHTENTKAGKVLQRDKDGIPIVIEGERQYDVLDEGEVFYSKNKITISTFIGQYNQYFNKQKPIENIWATPDFTNAYSSISNNNQIFEHLNHKVTLYVSSDPYDILRMSLSPYFTSCQNFYNGSHNHHLPATVFDYYTKICYIKSDVKYKDQSGNMHDYTTIARTLLRQTSKGLYVENAYTSNFHQLFVSLVEKYLGLKHTTGGTYHFLDVGLTRKTGEVIIPYFDSIKGTPIKKNLNALNDPKIVSVSKTFNIDPYTIISNEKNKYLLNGIHKMIFDFDELTEFVENKVRNTIYKEAVYVPYIDIDKLISEVAKLKKPSSPKDYDFDSFYGFRGDSIRDYIFFCDGRGWDSKKKFHRSKPFIKEEFFKERITPKKINNKINLWKKFISKSDDYFIFDINSFTLWQKEEKKKKKTSDKINTSDVKVAKSILDTVEKKFNMPSFVLEEVDKEEEIDEMDEM